MKLEVNEVITTENATEDDLKTLDFKQTVALHTGPDHYLQLWIDEDGGDNELYFCPQGGSPISCIAPNDLDAAKCLELFNAFLNGDVSWADGFDWVDSSELDDDAEAELEEDLWEVYPCQFEDGVTAIVVYDHGISEQFDEIKVNQFVGVRVDLKSPEEDGLASESEDEVLEELEEAIANAVYDQGGVYVGRITYEGQRHFYNYLDATAVEIEELLGELKAQCEYELEFVLETDPEKSRYWDDLYPPEEGLNLIMDTKLVHLHVEEGDHLEAPRNVDFWIDLPTAAAADKFESWAQTESFAVTRHEAPESDDDLVSLVISKEMPIELPNVFSVTSQIMAKASELEGEYVGWECAIVNAV